MWTVHRSQAGAALFGQTGFVQWDLVLAVGALIGVVTLGSWAIYRIKRWREELAEDAPLSPEQQIENYQKMVADGLLDAEDFTRIKAQLERRISDATPAAPIPPPSNQPPDTSIRES